MLSRQFPSREYWIEVQILTDESISEETPYFTDLTVTRDPAWNTRRIH